MGGSPPVHAAIFDIDGTLINSYGIDDALYADAVQQALGPVRLRGAWEDYAHVSDTGILADICADNDMAYSSAVSARVMEVYLRSLLARTRAHGPYQPVPGALSYLNALRARPDVGLAYATGGWRKSAEHKLSSAGFPLNGVPLACADDYPDRTQIMLHALGQLAGRFTSVTYFGDGLWDRAAADQLGWEFVAVGPKLGGIDSFDALPPDIALHCPREA